VLAPYVVSVRAARNLTNMFAFVSSDGEQTGIATMMEPDSLKLLEDSLILEAKHSASFSAKGNALDIGNLFKATKARVKHQSKLCVEGATADLRRVLDQEFSKMAHFKVTKKKHHVDAICRVVACAQQTLTKNIITNGFSKSGQWNGTEFDFDARMRCSNYKFKQNELQVQR
jgi:hypothetical protein